MPGFRSYLGVGEDNEASLSIFVRKELEVKKVEDLFVYKSKNSMVGDDPSTRGIDMLHATIGAGGEIYEIYTVHGLWFPGVKIDHPETILQSRNICKFISKAKGKRILCGDFNLYPETESIMAIGRAGMRDLIKDYGVISTRSSYYKYEKKFADYVFVSKEVKVGNFEALQDEVSDHLPLALEFE